MENSYLMVPSTMAQNRFGFNGADDAVVIEDEPVMTKAYVNFLEANTNAISMDELTSTCVVPTWGNQELTISHQDFISTVHDAACSFFSGETVNDPDIRVSHIVRGAYLLPYTRSHQSFWNVRKRSSTRDWLSLSLFLPSMKP